MSSINGAPSWGRPVEAEEAELPDWAQCASCGIAVDGPFAREEVDELEVQVTVQQVITINVVRCATCAAIRERAEALLREHPSERARIGSQSIATHRLECALDALDAVSAPPEQVAKITASSADIRSLIAYLAVPGGTARWAAHVMLLRPRQSAPAERWEHLSGAERAELREALAALLRARVEAPRPYACPSDTGLPGCLLCGVGTVLALPSTAEHGLWVEMSADSASLGGPARPDSIDGYVCLTCDAAIDSAGAVGQTAMTLSVLRLLGVPPGLKYFDDLAGVVGWATLRGEPPNVKPWEHLDLSELREAAAKLTARPLTRVR